MVRGTCGLFHGWLWAANIAQHNVGTCLTTWIHDDPTDYNDTDYNDPDYRTIDYHADSPLPHFRLPLPLTTNCHSPIHSDAPLPTDSGFPDALQAGARTGVGCLQCGRPVRVVPLQLDS